jgi:hypothetical protein
MKRTEKRPVSPEMCFVRRAEGYTPSDHEVNEGNYKFYK